MSDLPLDERRTFKQEVVGVNQNVQFDYTLTAAQAEDLLLDMDQLRLDHSLTPEQVRLYQVCQSRLSTESRPPNTERADLTVAEQQQELRDYIEIMKGRKRGA